MPMPKILAYGSGAVGTATLHLSCINFRIILPKNVSSLGKNLGFFIKCFQGIFAIPFCFSRGE